MPKLHSMGVDASYVTNKHIRTKNYFVIENYNRRKIITSIKLFDKFKYFKRDRYLTLPLTEEIALELKSSFWSLFLSVMKVFVSIRYILFS